MLQEFAVPTSLMFFMFVGVLLKKYTFIKKTYLPAPIIGGLIGFILMNTGVLNLPYATFERITFHLFSMSFISITYMTMNQKKGTNKGVFKGGLWLALVFGMMIAVQIVIGSSIFLGYNLIAGADLMPALGGLVAHGFGQGPGQAVAMGTIWQSFGVNGFDNAAQYGLFYAATGYLFAILIGLPYAKRLITKGKVSYNTVDPEQEINFNNGLIENDDKEIIGIQTAHHSNLDTLSLHFALTGGTYFITYLFIFGIDKLVGGFSPATGALMYGNMFAWGILFAMLFKALMKKAKLGYIIDDKLQKSITGFLVDFLMVSALMAISLQAIREGLVAIVLVVLITGFSTFFLVRFFAKRSSAYQYERFMCEFGIVTGTAATGMLLLRSVDPQFKTPVINELAWWNILQMFVALPIITSQIGLPVTNFAAWFIIMFVAIIVYFVLLIVFKLFTFKAQVE